MFSAKEIVSGLVVVPSVSGSANDSLREIWDTPLVSNTMNEINSNLNCLVPREYNCNLILWKSKMLFM